MPRTIRTLLCLIALVSLASAQAPVSEKFEAASLRPATPDSPYHPTIDLDASDYFRDTGGLITADGLLINYIIFAYKIADTSQYATINTQLPKWAQSERYILQARPEGHPTKDQIRLMMKSLLTERFNLTLHTEPRQLPIYALTLELPGKPGPHLKPHPAGVSCTVPSLSPTDPKPATPPSFCAPVYYREDGLLHMKIVGWTMEQIAGDFATTITRMDNLDPRPVLDRTGLRGAFDIDVLFLRQTQSPPAAPDITGPTFTEALRSQTGLRLTKDTGTVQVVVVDHVDKPTEN